jgi:quinol monooxygenase YgiN
MPNDLSASGCAVVELRQYTLHPGRRDALIDLFDREFVETQEAVGMTVMGQFRDLDDADRFVWLRGFQDMAARQAGLTAFYGGPVWQAHREAANATMVDSDNVLLLRPAWPGAGIGMTSRTRAAPGATAVPGGLLDASVFYLHEPAADELLARCREVLSPLLARAGAHQLGWYVTEPTPNNFPRLPVREGEPVLVGLAMFDGLAAFDAFVRSGVWAREAQAQLAPWLARPAESHRLVPTARSALHA